MVPPIPDPARPVPETITHIPTRRPTERARDLLALVRAARSSTDSSSAITLLERARSLAPADADILWELGWRYQTTTHWNEALETWATLARIQPDYPGLSRYQPIVAMRRDRAQVADTLPPTAPLPIEETPRPGEPVTVRAVGDVQLGSDWPPDQPHLPPRNGRDLFDRVRHILQTADITFGNLETVLADSGRSTKCRRSSTRCFAFRAPSASARALREAGFDVLSINNNHTGDFGEAGRRATANALAREDLLGSGPATGIATWETRGLRIALLAFSSGSGFRIQDVPEAARLVREVDRRYDLVFVSVHGGAEGPRALHVPRRVERAFGENRGDVYRFAHAAIDAGADLVLGHGPHVLRGMERYRGRLIAYSLGNFSTWHGFTLRGPTAMSAVLDVRLAPNGVLLDASIIPLRLDRPGIPTPDDTGGAVATIRRLSQEDFGSPLFDEQGRWHRAPGPTGREQHQPPTRISQPGRAGRRSAAAR